MIELISSALIILTILVVGLAIIGWSWLRAHDRAISILAGDLDPIVQQHRRNPHL